MKRIIWAVLILVAVGAGMTNAKPMVTAATTLFRICDSIGRQYCCVSSSMANTYGFGGDADTLSTDSTVARGCQMNIHRVMEANDPAIAELLPALISSQTQLDSSYLYSKWSSVAWALNNYYSSSGGLSGIATTWGPDSGRFSPRFARLARANGIYLSPHTVYSSGMNFASAKIVSATWTLRDSNAIDSTLYGPCPGSNFYSLCYYKAGTSTGSCTLAVYGSNQNLVHGRRWVTWIANGVAVGDTDFFTPCVAGDSIYNIDSIKSGAGGTGGDDSLKFLLQFKDERVDSL